MHPKSCRTTPYHSDKQGVPLLVTFCHTATYAPVALPAQSHQKAIVAPKSCSQGCLHRILCEFKKQPRYAVPVRRMIWRAGCACRYSFLLILLTVVKFSAAFPCGQAPGLLQWHVAGNCTIDLAVDANVKSSSVTLIGEHAGRLPVVHLKGKGAVQGWGVLMPRSHASVCTPCIEHGSWHQECCDSCSRRHHHLPAAACSE